MELFGYIILSLVILLLMVLIHESGHYTAAKILGFTVEEFAVGFGPKLLSKRRKNGELFSIRALPLGGFCAFLGEDEETEAEIAAKTAKTETVDCTVNPNAAANDTVKDAPQGENEDLLSYVMRKNIEDKEQERIAKEKTEPPKPVRLDKDGNRAKTFNEQKPWKRIIVLISGALFNFISAFVFSLIYIWAVGYQVPVVNKCYTNGLGEKYAIELCEGDVITSVNGTKISVLDTFGSLTSGAKLGDKFKLTVRRDGKLIEVDAECKNVTITDDKGEPTTYTGLGISTLTEFEGNNAKNAFLYCVPYTFKLSWSIIGSFFDIFTGRVPVTSVSGPIGSISLMAQLSLANWRNILILLPLLASNLAIFNILPFPALDGSKVIFTTIEWIRGKPINRKVEAIIHFAGMIVLLLFVLIVDILSFVL